MSDDGDVGKKRGVSVMGFFQEGRSRGKGAEFSRYEMLEAEVHRMQGIKDSALHYYSEWREKSQ